MINALYDYRQYRYSLYFPLPKLFGKIEKSAALSLMNAVDKFRGPCIHMMIPFRDSMLRSIIVREKVIKKYLEILRNTTRILKGVEGCDKLIFNVFCK